KEIDLKNRGIDLTSEQARQELELTRQIAATKAQVDQVNEARELLLEPFKNAIRGIQQAFTDAFENIFSGGVNSFRDLADAAKRILIRMAAEISSAMVFRAVIQPIVGPALGLGGGVAGVSGAAGAANIAAGGGGIGDFLGLGRSIAGVSGLGIG